ncbi:peptidoglycan DD-metalloendopeptidase family protein [Polaribacter batillariae]|uniref:Peptidoglycan DD-metalloendopeptidase family protein n=1 Tax=Polaribacter batillariae TaxID=2808900 RepID=A0ABX7T0M0_9FLAO|nr:peptidoglycan DD-metalloendopeptidase family protein [Polaribacter batillariae]QTD39075.1 peptidoglycan DD-metalloendopeptidase family protein [Polaribacter batillariae]
MKKALHLLLFIIVFSACNTDKKKPVPTSKPVKPKPVYRYGYKINDYKVIQDTIKSGESFGYILDRHHVSYPKINNIATSIKDIFDVRRVRAGKPYTILASKDSLEEAKVFIYKNDKIRATVVDFSDSIVKAHTFLQPIKTVERIVEGKIYSNLSNAMDSLHLSPNLTYTIADIYAWTLDFYKLQKGDSFKIIFEEKFIKDSLFAGYGNVKSAVFKHNNQDLYAFRFVADSVKGIPEYYDENGNMLRSQFLKSPIKFQYRISSRYNLKRRIAYYGYKVKPHKGTDFAANIGTPIIATASGTVIESRRKGGNGNYVKIKHNGTYATQYLHMKKRKVKKGDYVKQGQVIGTVGMTGNTGGPHVCYRFWKNGRQVDPLSPKTKLPEAEPLHKNIKPRFLKFIEPLKYQLDYNQLPTKEPSKITEEIAQN